MSDTDSIIQAESGGNPNAQNPNSSASGPGQFIDSTWLDTLTKHRPDIQGTPEQLLALKTDPSLAKDMTAAYAGDNQAYLQQKGLPVTPGTTYLAHFAGPEGAAKVLQADPNASVSDVLGPAVMKANPFLQGMNAQGLQAWAAKKMGTAPVTASAAPGTPSAPPAPPLPQQQQPIFAQAPQAAPAAAPSIPTPQGAQPIFARQQTPNLAPLKAMLQARQQAPIFAGQG